MQQQAAATPKAEVPQTVITAPTPAYRRPISPTPLPRSVTPEEQLGNAVHRRLRSQTPPPAPAQRQPTPLRRLATPQPPPPPIAQPSPPPSPGPHRAIRSATTSPTQPPAGRQAPSRQALTRPPSVYSITGKSDVALRPHPLIRGHSYGRDGPLKPLKPLMVASGAQAQISASPPSAGPLDGKMSTSPSSMRTVEAPTQPSSPAQRQLRRTSVSSTTTASVAGDAVQYLRQQKEGGPRGHANERTRTISAISNASGTSLAALASLATHGLAGHHRDHHQHAPQSRQAPHFTVHFPPAQSQMSLETIHPLLPEPYLSQHLSMVRFRNPMQESFERVLKAKDVR
jgi:hypothetical protein